MSRLRGTVTTFDPKRSYGFLSIENGQQIFLHQRDLRDRYCAAPKIGETVSFETGQDKRGRPCAVDAIVEGRIAPAEAQPTPADRQPMNNANRVPRFGDVLPPWISSR